MSRVTRSCVVVVLLLTLSVLAKAQKAPASEPEVLYGQTTVEWPAPVPDAGLLLTVSGPDGLYLKQEHPAGSWARFSLADAQGLPRPDGLYKWELVSQAGWQEERQAQSGWFQIQGGRVVAEGTGDKQPVIIEATAPQNSLYVDNRGRVGIGTSVPGAQLHLKGTAPALAIEDVQTGGREYRLRSQETGSIGLFDEATGQARWLVDEQGRVGINTAKPTSSLTVDGYIESTKGFLVNGRPVGGIGLIGGSQPLNYESDDNNYFGTGAGAGGTGNSLFGAYAGDNTTGSHDSFFGYHAGRVNIDGSDNSFFGWNVGYSNSSGFQNSFFGANAGNYNTTGCCNSFFGYQAGFQNTNGYNNSFFGHEAGKVNTGNYNSFFGDHAGYLITVGGLNCFFGLDAGAANTGGDKNSFFGASAGVRNTTGSFNSSFGRQAGSGNTSGQDNSFFGSFTGESNTVENENTFVGSQADLDPAAPGGVYNATAIGSRSYVSRSNSLVLGSVNGVNGATAETFVGIGTPSPDRQLVVEGTQAIGRFRRFNATGPDFGPAFLFERARGTNTAPSDILAGDYLGKVQFRGRVGGQMPEYGALTFIASDTTQNGRFSFVDRDLVTERMVILNTGNVGIGTNAPTEALDVAGNLRVRGSIVYGAPAVPVPDYVFEPDYPLAPLAELRQYLTTEKHLPDVPAASEIGEKGVNLGEFQLQLLRKIEELTLYALQQDQANDRLKEEAAALKERVRALEEMVKTLVEKDTGGGK